MDHLKEFRNYLIEQGRSENTVNAYCRDIELYARWFEQANHRTFEPSLLVAPDLREYRTHSLDVERVSAVTWNRRRASLKVFSGWAHGQGLITGDPLIGVEPMAIEELPPYWLTAKEFRDFRRQLDIEVNTARTEAWKQRAIRDRAMAALMLYAGLRSSEVVALQTGDIEIREKSGAVRIRHGKGDKSAEQKIGREARLALQEWMIVRSDRIILFPGDKQEEPITTRQLERRLKAIAERAGIQDFWPHRLRHVYIRQLLVEKHVPLPWVQKLARHSRMTTTARYGQAGNEDLALAVEDL